MLKKEFMMVVVSNIFTRFDLNLSEFSIALNIK